MKFINKKEVLEFPFPFQILLISYQYIKENIAESQYE